MTKKFWKASIIRAIRTIAQTAIATIGTAFVLSDVKFVNIDTPATKSYVMYARPDKTLKKTRLMTSVELDEEKKAVVRRCVDFINAKYGEGTATADIRHQYYNMRKQVEPHYHIVEKAIKAMEMEGIQPKVQPIRGGTDGANLSFMGLPCPNLFAGGLNFHGKMEFVPLENMEAASRVILNLISLFAK